MKLADLPIEPVLAYFENFDNIMNFNKPEVAVLLGRPIDPSRPKHPFEAEIKGVVAQTLPEDVLLSAYFGVRKDGGTTALDTYNGIFKQKANLVVAGVLSEANGNYLPTGPLTEADRPTRAYDAIVDFLKAVPLTMKMGAFRLKLSLDAAQRAVMACEAKYPYSGPVTLAVLQDRLRSAAMCPGMALTPTFLVGSGDYLEASVDGATELSFAPDGSPFLDIRTPFRDKNVVQYWAQYLVATRISTISPKRFVCSQAVNTMPEKLFGDY